MHRSGVGHALGMQVLPERLHRMTARTVGRALIVPGNLLAEAQGSEGGGAFAPWECQPFELPTCQSTHLPQRGAPTQPEALKGAGFRQGRQGADVEAGPTDEILQSAHWCPTHSRFD